ncbi:Dolichyl-phosphate-mannose-protein mannosyltransferase [Singulisphaera sp. GP187]|uniref:ArnT family glycosyltransferase n=1 Tax=Singulisphaera sp. GP187 TaxID=1882752 RepID=UPI000925D9B4|nr:glycosyltransferase family 39 protein [Singulisphaera sp. GP187]SIO42875.1 Dolichyl-phosphate-mannose-protein mannosyltransferase [Singulisphaera sp. GP187]
MSKRDGGWLVLMGALFLAWHLPLMFRTAAGMDEEFYGVVGITIQREGVPRVPYVPSRDPLFVYGVDLVVYTLPPLSFYLQALVHLVFGQGLGQARLASALEGLAATWLVYDLGRRWLENRTGALWGALLYLFGRAAYFPATTARPDMAATTFGLLAVWCLVRDGGQRRTRWLVASGVAGGLSMLCHPVGIVPCIQIGLALLFLGRPEPKVRPRLAAATTFSVAALAGLALWGPLIARHPDLFWIQFQTNVLGRVGSGLSRTLPDPLAAFGFQARQFLATALPVQAVLYGTAAAWVAARARWSGPERALGYHLVASSLLLVLLMGRHPLRAYFAFPIAFACIAAGGLAGGAAARATRRTGRPVAVTLVMTGLLIASLVPGSGLRTLVAHVRYWDDPAYDAHKVAARMMDDLDPEALIALDDRFILDFYLAGRRVVDAKYLPFLADDYDYLLVDSVALGLSQVPPENLELIRKYGDSADEFAPSANLYRPIRTRSPLP